jgi:hypothetical protein
LLLPFRSASVRNGLRPAPGTRAFSGPTASRCTSTRPKGCRTAGACRTAGGSPYCRCLQGTTPTPTLE